MPRFPKFRVDPWRPLAFAACTSIAGLPQARADCIDDAAARQGVNAAVLRAIGWQESRLEPSAVGRNRDGSIDRGAFQINSRHFAELARFGIPEAALADGCLSAHVAAWHYRRQVDRFGNSWAAVGAYHSRTPITGARYANAIAGVLMRWRVLPEGPLPYPHASRREPSPRGSDTGAPPPAMHPPASSPEDAVGQALHPLLFLAPAR